MLSLAEGSFVVDSTFALAPLLLAIAMVICGAILLAKGRVGWFAIGLLAPFLVWPIAAFVLPPTPRSPWMALRARRARLALTIGG